MSSSATTFQVVFPGECKPRKPDFLICGAGTTGLCLAYSLTNKGYYVCMLEQGKDQSQNEVVQQPFSLSYFEDGTPILSATNAVLSTETTNFVGNANGNGFGFRVEPIISGCGVGGGGLHWYLEYVTPDPFILDGPLYPGNVPPVNTSTYSFVEAGGDKWSYDIVRSYIKANENFRQINGSQGLTENPSARGYAGATTALQLQSYPPLGPPGIVQNSLAGAATTLPGGAPSPVVEDYNIPENINSTSQIQFYLNLNLNRQNSVTSFANETIVEPSDDIPGALVGVDGRRLVILTERSAVRAVRSHRRCSKGRYVAKGVEFLYKNKLYFIKAKNVVASMGAGFSPTFWMRSGFGDFDELDKLGIPKEVSMPLLGTNLQNQYGPSMLISTSNPIYSEAFLGQTFVQYNNTPRKFQV